MTHSSVSESCRRNESCSTVGEVQQPAETWTATNPAIALGLGRGCGPPDRVHDGPREPRPSAVLRGPLRRAGGPSAIGSSADRDQAHNARVVALTLKPLPVGMTHWSTRDV